MMVEGLKYWVGVSGFMGMGFKRLELLIKYFGSVEKVYKANKNELVKVGIKKHMVEVWDRWRRQTDLDRQMERMEKGLIKIIRFEDKEYPKLLKEIDSPPIVLYIKGKVKVLKQPALTVVGTRKMTEYGRRATERLVGELARNNLVVVSGLARGIDGWAHRVCLGNKGITIGVLGHGLDKIYPREHTSLAEKIVISGGVIMSEYPLNYPIAKHNFPQRDRILAGLSLGTLVIEGGKKSGTKITASMAADYGREVFCVPGPIESQVSEGPAELIQQGAKLVIKAEDVLDEIVC